MDETVTSHRNQDESFLPRSTNANCYKAKPTSYRPCGNSPPTGRKCRFGRIVVHSGKRLVSRRSSFAVGRVAGLLTFGLD